MAPIADLLGETVVAHGGSKVPVAQFTGAGKVVGIYFSAHWCPPCRGFTPVLADFYKAVKASPKKDQLEIVFVSSDREEAAWKEYFAEMPWLALTFADRARKEELCKKFGVTGIPTLVFLDANTGAVLHANGRDKVTSDPTGARFPW